MKEINDTCPRCNQYRLLRSINFFDDRRHGIKISKDVRNVNYLCYNCLDEIDKGIKEGKKKIIIIMNSIIQNPYQTVNFSQLHLQYDGKVYQGNPLLDPLYFCSESMNPKLQEKF